MAGQKKFEDNYLGVPIVTVKTKTFTALINQRALLVSRNTKKNLKNNSENNGVRNLIREIFPKICFVFIVT